MPISGVCGCAAAAMLVKLQRTTEAVKYGLKSFKRPDQALALAKVLCEAAAHDDALKIADAGLGLASDGEEDMASPVVPLAHWLRDYAGGMGKTAVALKAARRRSNTRCHWMIFAPSKRGPAAVGMQFERTC